MKVECWCMGKTTESYLKEGIDVYVKRLGFYFPFQWLEFPDVKPKLSDPLALKRAEGQLFLQKIKPDDYVVLLDEAGREYSSVELSAWLERRFNAAPKRVLFLVGGAFGFSPDLYGRAQEQWSLSRLTFSHQMIRLFAAEQLYRAMTILKNEPYHNP
ncbi:MAG: 23S rRNA (pseudouridine(1915)-N(3))-methyltransferase RlmH [Saprospiraceae bacterium]